MNAIPTMPSHNGLSFTRRSALWDTCQLLLVSKDQDERVGSSFRGAMEFIEGVNDLRTCLEGLEGQRFASIGVTCPKITSFVASDRGIADRIRRLCSDRTIFVHRSPDPSATTLRKLLHSTGFYEIAEPEDDKLLNFDRSSVSGLPDGTFEMQSSRPGLPIANKPQVLVASRLAMSSMANREWTLYGNPLLEQVADEVTSSDGDTIGIATRQACGEVTTEHSTLTVTAQLNWTQVISSGAFAGIVGSYSGPGDSNMYAAMFDAYASPFAQISIWRCDNNWEKIAFSHFPLDPNKTTQSLGLTLTIAPTSVAVAVNKVPVLWVYDAQIVRTKCYGIRMRGNQFSLSHLSASQGHK